LSKSKGGLKEEVVSMGVPGLALFDLPFQVQNIKVNPPAFPDNGQTPGPDKLPN
jgi:hypothetical protein